MKKIPSSEITPEHLYLSRRKFIREAGITAAAAALLAACGAGNSLPFQTFAPSEIPSITGTGTTEDELMDEPLTDYDTITTFNNYYEFSTDYYAVSELAEGLKTDPWSIVVSGHVANPRTFTMEDLLKFEQEERIYRFRCVEAWSMVIPWTGFPLSKLLKEVQPDTDAKFVQFTTLYDPEQMPGLSGSYPWPYKEGLRLDEAMHDLTILATGLYDKSLLPQNGAPVRLVVPWKYGFKSIKSVVKIELMTAMPLTFWSAINREEYGFYANVNPNVDHPRWSQKKERRLGEDGLRDTLLFNGYEEEVASMYKDMDLSVWY